MSIPTESKDLLRHELYVGVFENRSWTSASLCNYFERLIKGSSIIECHFYPCTSAKLNDHSFAVLTFASASSIDQCLAKHYQIKQEHRLVVKRNLRDMSKDQRPVCKYISIHLDKFDPSFNRKNVLSYFGDYGSIVEWKILDDGYTFLIHFKDYDSVDRIFLDQPHFINEKSLSIRKCFNPFTVTLNYPIDNRLQEKKRNLQASIDRSKYAHESELIKLNKKLKEEISLEEDRLAEKMKAYIRLERIQRDLKQDLINARQMNQQLRKQLQETMQRNERIGHEYESQLEKQRSINKSLQESISYLDQIH